MFPKSWYAAGLLVAAAALVGCEPAAKTTDPAVLAQHREQFVLTEEPAGAVTTVDLREQEIDLAAGPVTLVGQIGGLPNPWADTEKAFPWVADEATFFLVDQATADEFADHAPDDPDHHENCPFCARAAAKSVQTIATVTFKDAAGKPIAIDARELFDLKANDVVVVRGQGRLVAGDLLVLEADGMYVRR